MRGRRSALSLITSLGAALFSITQDVPLQVKVYQDLYDENKKRLSEWVFLLFSLEEAVEIILYVSMRLFYLLRVTSVFSRDT